MNSDYVAKLLANMTHSQAMEALAKSQELRKVEEGPLPQPAKEEIEALKAKYEKLASYKTKVYPIFGGEVTIHLEFDEKFYAQSISLEHEDSDNPVVKILKTLLEHTYACDFALDLPFLDELNNKAAVVVNEIYEFVDKWDDPSLLYAIKGEERPKWNRNLNKKMKARKMRFK